MQKSIPISILLFFVLSCKNSHKTHPVHADTLLTAPHQTIKDTPLNGPTTQKSFPKSTNITMVVEKMDNHVTIGEVDYEIIDRYLLYNKNESSSEGVGYSMFQYLKGNKPANEAYFSFLDKKGNTYKEKILSKILDLMCIDVSDENYSYEKLVIDFSIFKKSNAAKIALQRCIDNAVK